MRTPLYSYIYISICSLTNQQWNLAVSTNGYWLATKKLEEVLFAGILSFISERVFCDQFVMEEWQTIRRLFGVKMVEFWAQIWTEGAWRTSSQVSSNNISKYRELVLNASTLICRWAPARYGDLNHNCCGLDPPYFLWHFSLIYFTLAKLWIRFIDASSPQHLHYLHNLLSCYAQNSRKNFCHTVCGGKCVDISFSRTMKMLMLE